MLKKVFVLIVLILQGVSLTAQDYCHNLPSLVYAAFTARQCDSLIKANAGNPNFAIIDVRTPGEYLPKHIEGAINRNSGDSNFNDQLKKLDKNKTWLLHCQSGARSAGAFATMKTLGFREVYNMSGGLNSWNSASLPTTAGFAPRWGLYECAFSANDTLPQLQSDTINIRITNAENDTLKIYSVGLSGSFYFTQLPFASVNLLGSQSDTVQVIFSSPAIRRDSVSVLFATNLGNKEVKLVRTVVANTGIEQNTLSMFEIYPVPANERIYIKNVQTAEPVFFRIFEMDGKLLKSGQVESNAIDISDIDNGFYLIRFETEGQIFTKKLIKSSN